MHSKTILENIRTLIAQNELEKAIQELNELLKGSKLLDKLILQSARYNNVMEKIREGTVNYENANVTKIQIIIALTDITAALENGVENDVLIGEEIERVNNIINNNNQTNSGSGDNIVGDKINRQINLGDGSTYNENNY